MNFKKIILSGVIIWIVNAVFGFLTCGWLFNWVYKIPPNIWVDPETMMSGANMLWANLVGLLSGLIFATVYG